MSAAPLIKFLKDGKEVSEKRLDSDIDVGRESGCVIQLNDHAISRKHAVIRQTRDGVQLMKKSKFGKVKVNGEEITSAVVKSGDLIELGPYLMKLEADHVEEVLPSENEVISDENIENNLFEEPVVQEEKVEPLFSNENSGIDLNMIPESEDESEDPSEFNVGELEFETPEVDELQDIDQPNDGMDIQIDFEVPSENLENKDSGDAIALEVPDPVIDIPVDLNQEMNQSVDEPTQPISTQSIDVKLILISGDANHKEFPITSEEISIGRGKRCDLVLEDKRSSRKNSVIKRVGANFLIQDLDSSNGTFVNGAKVQEQILNSGDLIKIGSTEFEFLAKDGNFEHQELEFQPVEEIPASLPQEVSEPQDQNIQEAVLDLENLPTSNNEFSEIPGMNNGGEQKKKGSLLDKYKSLPKRQRIYIILIVFLAIWTFFDTEPEISQKKASPQVDKNEKIEPTFETLSVEQQKFVKLQHQIAFDYYRNKEYDKALFEIRKIFQLINDYKDSREIERYSIEGKKKLEALKEEKKKREEENRIREKISQLTQLAQKHMSEKKFSDAQALFPEILALDPENVLVSRWQREIERYQVQKEEEANRKKIQDEINSNAWKVYKKAKREMKKERYLNAISIFKQVLSLRATDQSVNRASKKGIRDSNQLILEKITPLIESARQYESAGEYQFAFKTYQSAKRLYPYHNEASDGLERTRKILHEKAKLIYTEAVIAESYSDFSEAKQKFSTVLSVAPEGDEYIERAKRRLGKYSIYREETEDY
ncbi:MAG: hypothetical protein CL678_10145 [Bdellovibrionaceae bacterium]|nr:hypothetical protein [Pseudobdellovibrionaceae bacterium]|tara:strand:- start:5256 stop:7559 length:2304 start_codon:yes stop_codon:yes gene_type:complete